MPVYRCTVFMGQANMGWSETYYATQASIVALCSPLSKMLDHRNDMLTGRHSFLGVRVSVEGSQRKGRLFLPGVTKVDQSNVSMVIPPTGDYPEGQSPLAYDQVRACMQIELALGGEKLSLRYLTGIPDAVTKTESATLDRDIEPTWWKKFDSWRAYCIANGFSVKVQNKSGANPERAVVAYTLQDVGPSLLGVTIPLSQALEIPAPPGGGAAKSVGQGDKVILRAVKMDSDGIRPPNGTWVVDSVADNSEAGRRTYYLRKATGFDPSDVKVLGAIRAAAYTYVVPDSIIPVRAGIHKRGKPFGSPRGRVRVKRYAV